MKRVLPAIQVPGYQFRTRVPVPSTSCDIPGRVVLGLFKLVGVPADLIPDKILSNILKIQDTIFKTVLASMQN